MISGRDITFYGALCGIAPATGSGQAIVREESSLAGGFVVPADANLLDLSVAVLSEIGSGRCWRRSI